MMMMMMMVVVMMMMILVMINNNHNNDGYVYIYIYIHIYIHIYIYIRGGLISEIGVGELSIFIPCCTWSISMWVWFNIMKTYSYNTVVKYKTSWGLIYIYIYLFIYTLYIYIYYIYMVPPPPKKKTTFLLFLLVFTVCFVWTFATQTKECSNMSEACKPASATCSCWILPRIMLQSGFTCRVVCTISADKTQVFTRHHVSSASYWLQDSKR